MATNVLPSPHILDDDDAPAAIPRARKPAPARMPAPARKPAPARMPALMRRLYAAIIISQSRRAQREIDRMLGAPAFRDWRPPQT